MFFQSLVEICPFITSCFWGPAHWSYCKDHNNPSDSLSTFQALFKFWVGKKICDDHTATNVVEIFSSPYFFDFREKKAPSAQEFFQPNKLIFGCTCTFDNEIRQNIRFKYSKCTILCTIFVFSWVFHCLYLSIMCFGLEGCGSTFNAKKIEYAYVLSSRRKRWMIIGKRVGEKDRRHHSIYIY